MSSEAGPAVVELEVRSVVVGLFRENCWVVGSRRRGEACVIDPGDEPEEILALARDMGVRITRVVASHAHLDHIMAARDIVEATGAPFLMHASDVFIADSLPDAARNWLGREVRAAPRPDAFVVDGQDLEIAGVNARVMHTPGHTPGSVCVYAPEAGLLFSGDTLFRESIGRTDLPGGDAERLLRSISQRLFVLPEDTRVLPGHMQETSIGYERVHNPFVGARR
ncbi:MAG: MBL fold metallo-hydrolase [Chloroflexota bacterium]|nr:MBL fold metallo-hydrolase [Chloroflexota bacterium]